MELTLSWRSSVSHKNQSTDLLCKSMDWFLYDWDLLYERVKRNLLSKKNSTIDVVLVSLLLGLNIFHTFFYFFLVEFEQVKLLTIFAKTSIPANTSRGFHVETTWKLSLPRRFNVESTWCVCWDLRCLTEFPLRQCIQWDVIRLCIQWDVIRLCVQWDVMRVFTIDWTTFRTFLLITSSLGSTATLLLGSKS